MKTQCLDLKSSLLRLKGWRKGKQAYPKSFREEKFGVWLYSFSNGEMPRRVVGRRLMRYVAIRKVSS